LNHLNNGFKSAITPKRYEIRCQLALITNKKSHTGFDWYRPRRPWMTLNGAIALILRYSRRFQ